MARCLDDEEYACPQDEGANLLCGGAQTSQGSRLHGLELRHGEGWIYSSDQCRVPPGRAAAAAAQEGAKRSYISSWMSL